MKSPLNPIIAKELRGFSKAENEATWVKLKSALDSYGAAICRQRPSLWYRLYGLGNPSYLDLLFRDSISSLRITRKYGFRRSVALIAIHALSENNEREVGRAIFLLSFHSHARQTSRNRLNAANPRQRSGKPTDMAIRQQTTKFLRTPSHHRRNLVAFLKSHFESQGQSISTSALGKRLKKMGI